MLNVDVGYVRIMYILCDGHRAGNKETMNFTMWRGKLNDFFPALYVDFGIFD